MSNTTAAAPAAPKTDLQAQARDFADASYGWFATHWLQILIAVGAGIVLFVALHFVKGLGKRLCARDATHTGWGTIFGRALSKTGNFFIAMAAAQIVVSFAQFAQAPAGVVSVVHFLFTIAAVFQGAIWAREIILGAIEHRTTAEDYHGEALVNAMGLIRVLVSFTLFAIALVLVLGNLGVNVTGLIAGLGVGGIAIGLAAQSIFADLFAAIAIIFDRPFKKGDAITFDKSAGTVERIGMRSTRIRGTAGEARIIGNKKLLDNEIINNTQREFRRIIFTLGVVQTTPVDVMEQLPHLLKDIVEDHEGTFIRAGFVAFGAQSYDFEVQFDSASATMQDMFDLRHSVGLAIVQRFNEDGIGLAYPTQVGLTAEEAGLVQPKRAKKIKESNETIAKPPSSGDTSAADQEGGA
ncbi:mechanosensitive ion channel family protein [Sphingomonas panacisoli]|uniref:Small-conductance mechanosensitive channel n=1 Tax=Sphingomonas panacisoli TaxID=1813879 RepID=A0A5B8LF35_9SPHN|nr:mechanosensitive ion channel family protein [Sphingomonas panacisoli]QDZ06546.1 mechanosensitive ion channel family protein [Sphingomonas panacisoli]